ncbi:natural cytotoxicity triggering receptor 2 [Suncus etruscus]|uniref:natural cytotoxicity triggering receptor 2 n=1 Tax=Suncus etruscus TaxID=109475 RepID=UPI0021109055|nr:natural cytotoxicity triggering receptor 2 [Suncus etruscus]
MAWGNSHLVLVLLFLASEAQYFLWDNPVAGFFIVIITNVKKKNTGLYWCGTNVKSSIQISRKIRLEVVSSPGLDQDHENNGTTAPNLASDLRAKGTAS